MLITKYLYGIKTQQQFYSKKLYSKTGNQIDIEIYLKCPLFLFNIYHKWKISNESQESNSYS